MSAKNDRYLVSDFLSEGGMGAIYLGKRLGASGFEKKVVLKQLLPAYAKEEEIIEMFLREARLCATLDHANIVQTMDFVASGEDYFMVMEYVPGGDLRNLLERAKARGQHLSLSACIYIVREVLAGLGYAHVKRDLKGRALKIIHRDVTPSNILISEHGEVKIADFGIAKASTFQSTFHRVRGKVGYMSPEQARMQSLDHRADLYAVAVCLHEMIRGERLFVEDEWGGSANVFEQTVPKLSEIPELSVPADLDAMLARALADNPAERYPTAGAFSEALARFAHKHRLLISATDLALELAVACGPAESWRSEDDIVNLPSPARPEQMSPPKSPNLPEPSVALVDSMVNDSPEPLVKSADTMKEPHSEPHHDVTALASDAHSVPENFPWVPLVMLAILIGLLLAVGIAFLGGPNL